MSPESLRQELRRMDRNMDVQRDPRTGAYRITGVDRGGQPYTVMSIPQEHGDKLGTHIVEHIHESTPHLNGGAAAVSRRVMDGIEKNNAAHDREMTERLVDKAKDAYQSYKYKTGSKVFQSA